MKFKATVVALFLVVIFILIQYYRPNKNIQKATTQYDFLISEKAPENIARLVKNSCYDCHSNYTNYHWYDNIAPISWFVDNNIKRGKEVLNFSEWKTTALISKKIIITAIPFDINNNKMPKRKYLLMKPKAVLSEIEKQQVIDWVLTVKANMLWDEPLK